MRHIKTICLKELRSYFDSPTAYIFIIIFLVLTGIYFVNTIFLDNVASLRGLFEIVPILFLVFIPSVTMRLIAEEKRIGTFEIIATKGVKTGEIIIGKFFAAWILVICALIPTLFYSITIAVLGNVDAGQMISGYLGLFLMSGAFIAVGMIGSSLTENPIIALIISFLLILVLFIIDKVLIYIPSGLVGILEYLGAGYHFSSLARGVIDSRDIVYFLSVIIVALLFASMMSSRESGQPFKKLREFTWSQQLFRFILVVTLIVFINLLSIGIFSRVDITATKIYTLSDLTHQYLEILDDNFIVTAFFSTNLPPPYHNHERYTRELLEEYRAVAPGKFHYLFIDPDEDKGGKELAGRLGITPIQVKVIKNDVLHYENIYIGLSFTYGGKHDYIPALTEPEQLEYFITSSIRKLTSQRFHTVAFLQGQGEPAIDKLSLFYRMLSRDYNVSVVDLSKTNEIPKHISALIIINPSRRFTDNEKYQIERFVMQGGKVGFFINMVTLDEETKQVAVSDLNLEDMFETYGWIIGTDLVVEPSLTVGSVSPKVGVGSLSPFSLHAMNFSSENVHLKSLGGVIFPSISSVDPRLASIRGVRASVFLTSSDRAQRIESTDLSAFLSQKPTQATSEGQFILASGFEGNFKSLFARKSTQQLTGGKGTVKEFQPMPPKSESTRIVVVGDGDFLIDRYAQGTQNVEFGSYIIRWLVEETALPPIPKREITPQPLPPLTASTKSFIKYFNFMAPPVFIILTGVFRLLLKSIRRRRHQNSYR